jgi:hypothetical protein
MYGKAVKKPVEINWIKWTGNNHTELITWVESFGQKYEDNFISDIENNKIKLFVKTLEGTSYDVPYGYTIIRGVEGEFYPCESKIFTKTYKKIK